MRKFYSLVLMAVALLVGTNAWAKTIKVAQVEAEGIDYTNLATAFSNASSGDIIQLQSAMTHGSYIWIGEAAQASASGTGKVLTLDLNGNMLTYTGAVPFLQLSHGKLTIKTTLAGGKIYSNTGNSSQAESVILVTGSTLKDCEPKTQTNYYSHLVIANGVEIDGQKNGIVVDGTHALTVNGSLSYTTDVYAASGCIANGVRVDVYGKVKAFKYGLKVNGNVTKPTMNDGVTLRSLNTTGTGAYDHTKVPAGYTVEATDVKYIPFIFIANGAELMANETANQSTGLYCSGYADYLVQGYVHGSTGVYVKSGNIEVGEGAQIASDNDAKDGIKTTGKSSGIDSGGNAIAIETNTNSYAGAVNVSITGGKITAGEDGYAIQNVNATGSKEVESVVISGGEFKGGAAGCVTIDASEGTPDVELEGGTFTGDIQTLINAVDDDQIIQQIVSQDNEGNATVVVGKKEAGDEIVEILDKPAFAFANDMANDIVMLAADEVSDVLSYTLPEGTTTVKYLSLTGKANSTDPSAPYTTTVTVEDGKTLSVGQVVMNAYGRIVVKAGGKLIITGNNGLFADDVNNIVLETEENKPAIFLFNPAVSNNRNPKATVQFTSKSFYTPEGYVFQRFGLPTMKDGLTSITGEGEPRTRFWSYDYSGNTPGGWKALGYIHGTGSDVALDYSKLNDPFDYYQMMNFDATDPSGVVYTFKGNLLGNTEPTMEILENSWKGFANSYMGVMELGELLDLIPNTVDKAVYTYNVDLVHGSWEPVTNLNSAGAKLNPMQPFLIRNRNAAESVELDYEATVYCPEVGCSNQQQGAPRRTAANNITMAKIMIANENSADYVIVAEDAEFTPAFDNGYDASKFMNDEVNLYVEAEENMSIFATNNLDNTTLGVSSVLGGTYTISFSNVNGDNFVLIDNMTGARIAMVEGNSYEFQIAANTVDSHRFEIVAGHKVPTAIENAEVSANAKGVYTLMGQYLGEDLSVLPAGVYVVNGVKIVK